MYKTYRGCRGRALEALKLQGLQELLSPPAPEGALLLLGWPVPPCALL